MEKTTKKNYYELYIYKRETSHTHATHFKKFLVQKGVLLVGFPNQLQKNVFLASS